MPNIPTTPVTTFAQDISNLEQQNVGYTLSTNALIQASLATGSRVQPTNISYLIGDVGDVITLTGAKTLHFLNCTNVGFSFLFNGAAATPSLIFENCILNSTYTDFIDLITIETSDKELSLEVKSCYDFAGARIQDYKYYLIGGVS